ncbi:hypothetical protein [Bacteroides pyogenes]|uniref:hypothetical protein n=1 Tax=Bacteroides pyogenes TaxID=310300 RepID=UPI002A909388|nr:hypothetical protein [Bacteroides pyogenes]MDY5433680.1 hypothetical protein [Bacteroides pyogenes]
MITTSINITPYLAEYLRGKFNNSSDEAFRIPDNTDLYHLVWQLMTRRPAGLSPIDTGNITFALPDRRLGKDPQVYNYLSPRSARLIDAEVRRMFNYELHAAMLENQENFSGLNNLDVAHKFLCAYGIESLSEDALLKNFYRYRDNIRKKKKRREYKKKLKSS